ncbi:MAG: hypothetical protein AAGJ83_16040, partial [Planctomycetota bacterium]
MRMTNHHLKLACLTLLISCVGVASAQGPALITFKLGDIASISETSHKAEVSVIEESAANGIVYAVKTFVDPAAEASKFFRTGFKTPVTDLSDTQTIEFWIKTDIEGGFNLQLQSGSKGVGVLSFSIDESNDSWTRIEARLSSLRVPKWARENVDLMRVNGISVVAFGSGPYDGKTILIRDIRCDVPAMGPNSFLGSSSVRSDRAKRLREPKVIRRSEPVDLFDGDTLNGWTPVPRLYVPKGEEFAKIPSAQLFDAVVSHYKRSNGQMNRVPDRQRVND